MAGDFGHCLLHIYLNSLLDLLFKNIRHLCFSSSTLTITIVWSHINNIYYMLSWNDFCNVVIPRFFKVLLNIKRKTKGHILTLNPLCNSLLSLSFLFLSFVVLILFDMIYRTCCTAHLKKNGSQRGHNKFWESHS